MKMKDHITPEVGDIWAFDNGLKFRILKETSSNAMPFKEDVKYPAYEVLEESLEHNFFDELPFINGTFKYLGHSKVKIDDLFKTEDDVFAELEPDDWLLR